MKLNRISITQSMTNVPMNELKSQDGGHRAEEEDLWTQAPVNLNGFLKIAPAKDPRCKTSMEETRRKSCNGT